LILGTSIGASLAFPLKIKDRKLKYDPRGEDEGRY
jgi:hypothetical protein